MNIVIEVDSKQLSAAFKAAPAKVVYQLNNWVNRTALRTEREGKKEIVPHVDTGQTQSSIHTTMGYLKATVSPHTKQAIFISQGRKPGSMPPYKDGSPLNSWARRRGLNPFLVARSIGRRGTKPHPFMVRAYQTVKPIAERDAQTALDNIVRSI